ncbi:hypothetical protein UFOVP32_72 [uncultured Caudovirales phage]|uniref:Uncharacterized protein n=1 Tax=uncultured Caudovirales phage TaxID=2100421 RepID=A0A6J5KKN1_9CAUD|nr:hypothetical protein UFOVP32_72 [uncultured Caudovirales phage]CAB4123531.1 hypothetical protein UFOVP50_4 [uncultured Caudovirales phage]
MTVSLKHSKTSSVADTGDANLVQSTDWNAEHVLTLSGISLIGRSTAGIGAAAEISVGTGLALATNTLSVSVGSVVQAWDADLDAIAALSGTSGLLKKTGTNTWSLDTSAYLTAITSAQVTTALTYTPANKTGESFTGSISTTGTVSDSSGNVRKTRSATPVTSTATLAWNSDSADFLTVTALAAAMTISADSGSPVDGQAFTFRIKDNNTARGLFFTTGATKAFRAMGVTLPSTTVATKTTYIGCIYNATDFRWDVVAVTTEA